MKVTRYNVATTNFRQLDSRDDMYEIGVEKSEGRREGEVVLRDLGVVLLFVIRLFVRLKTESSSTCKEESVLFQRFKLCKRELATETLLKIFLSNAIGLEFKIYIKAFTT